MAEVEASEVVVVTGVIADVIPRLHLRLLHLLNALSVDRFTRTASDFGARSILPAGYLDWSDIGTGQ